MCLGQQQSKSNQKVVWLYYLKYVMDHVTNYNFCHVIWNQLRTTICKYSTQLWMSC